MKKKLLLLLLACCGMAYAQSNDWEAKFTHYTPGQTVNVDTLRLEFEFKNNGPVPVNPGDTLYISLKVNTEFLGDMMPGSPPYYAYVMDEAVPVGQSVVLDPGYLLLDPFFLGFYGTPTLDICVVVWGIGLESVGEVLPAWPLDTNPSNNSACIVYDPTYSKPTDLAITFDNYANGQVTNNQTLLLNFTVQNLGPQNLAAGDTLYFSSRINGAYMGLNLVGSSTAYVLQQNLPAGGSLSINPGFLQSQQVLAFFPGTTSFEACVVVWGKNQYAVDTQTPWFPQDLDGTNNMSCITYSQNLSVGDHLKPNSLKMFPNPVKDRATFSFGTADQYLISIYDAGGREVMKLEENGSEISMDAAGLAKGLYIYRVFGNSGTSMSGKFMVE